MENSFVSISYSVLTHNETKELDTLLGILLKNTEEFDEIVIVDDFSSNPDTIAIIDKYKSMSERIFVYQHSLNKDFAQQKNFANSKCTKEYIFNIDADEIPSEYILKNIKEILLNNKEVEIYKIARVNTVNGITLSKIGMWGWRVGNNPAIINEEYVDPSGEFKKLLNAHKLILSEKDNVVRYYVPIINWPDQQCRIYKNVSSITWVNPVHESLIGYRTFANLPIDMEYALLHNKEITKQDSQNKFYSEINR